MAGPEQTTGRIEALRGLLERLGDPDLTLAEAKTLRAQLDHLLGQSDRDGEPDWVASSPVGPPGPWDDEPWPGGWSPQPTIGAIG